jgi:RNA ligase
MEILKRIDWKILNAYIGNKLIVANKHPEYDIWILNYSKECQFLAAWDVYTLSCRGMVVDADGNILARPFMKFKNYEEYQASEIDWSIPFETFEKMDGSLIILFYYNYKWIVASRGSFASEQAIEGERMLNLNSYACGRLSSKNTYLFEIIFPENRIVVNYGDRKELVMLGVIQTSTGVEMPYDDMRLSYFKYFTIVNKLELKSLNELRQLIDRGEDNKEGVVIRFSNGFRMKMKFAEYCRLHAIVTNVSNLTVWRHLMAGRSFDELIDRVPDEFFNWLKKTKLILQLHFNEIERQSLKEFVRIYHVERKSNRKDFALEALKNKKINGILFNMYTGRSYDEYIWKMVRPVFSKPFKDGFDNE